MLSYYVIYYEKVKQSHVANREGSFNGKEAQKFGLHYNSDIGWLCIIVTPIICNANYGHQNTVYCSENNHGLPSKTFCVKTIWYITDIICSSKTKQQMSQDGDLGEGRNEKLTNSLNLIDFRSFKLVNRIVSVIIMYPTKSYTFSCKYSVSLFE